MSGCLLSNLYASHPLLAIHDYLVRHLQLYSFDISRLSLAPPGHGDNGPT